MKPSISSRGSTRLIWAIRDSFLDYLRVLEDAAVEIDGVVQAGVPDAFVFPIEPTAGTDWIQARGRVMFTAHGGELSVEVANPRLRLSEGYITVYLEIEQGVWNDFARGRTTMDSLQIAIMNDVVLNGLVLTLKGSELFGTAYGPGARMAPLRLAVG